MKKFKLSGKIIKEIEKLPLVDIEAENISEAEEKYCELYANGKMKKGYVVKVKYLGDEALDKVMYWDDESLNNAIADHVLKED